MANPLEESEKGDDELFCLFVIFQEIHQSHIIIAKLKHAMRKSILWANSNVSFGQLGSSSSNKTKAKRSSPMASHEKNTNIKVKEKEREKKRRSRWE